MRARTVPDGNINVEVNIALQLWIKIKENYLNNSWHLTGRKVVTAGYQEDNQIITGNKGFEMEIES